MDGNGKVTSSDMLQVLRDLSGDFLTDEQRQVRRFKTLIIFFSYLDRPLEKPFGSSF